MADLQTMAFFANPVFKRSPFYDYIKKMGAYQKQDSIPIENIERDLSEMDSLVKQQESPVMMMRIPKVFQKQMAEHNLMIESWIAGIRNDLNDSTKYTKTDRYYLKVKKL